MNWSNIHLKSVYRKSIACLIFALSVFFLFSCSREQPAQSTVSSGSDKESLNEKVIAQVGQGAILENDLRYYINTRNFRGGKNVGLVIDKILKEMITGEALYLEAIRLGLDKDPAVRRNIRQMLSQELLKRNVTDPVIKRTITEEELQQYYQEHLKEFLRPNGVTKEFKKVRRFLERRLRKEELASKRKTYISGIVDTAKVQIMDDAVQSLVDELVENQGKTRSGNRANTGGPPALPGK